MAETIVPGKSIGKLRLGMGVLEAIRLRGRPQSTEWVEVSTVKNPKPAPTTTLELLWWEGGTADDPESWLIAHVKRERVVQLYAMGVNYRLTNGISTTSDFTRIRKVYPKLKVRAGYFGSEDEPGYVGYFFDEIAQGLAFTQGTQDDTATYNSLPKSFPASLVVHPPRQRVLLMEHGLIGLEETPLGETSKRIAAWLAGGMLKPW
ncbi:MAG: hypothetical protein NTX57_21600 [Armatimonadetes bacterium]|nr:hypothetical protein [Armatimonadota bacterium]